MLYLKASQSNTIAVTWTERANSATVYRLRLTNLATLEATDIYLNAIDNLSSYESRYDKFAFTLGALTKGQYRYEVTENPATYTAGDFVQGGLYTLRIAAMPTSPPQRISRPARRGDVKGR